MSYMLPCFLFHIFNLCGWYVLILQRQIESKFKSSTFHVILKRRELFIRGGKIRVSTLCLFSVSDKHIPAYLQDRNLFSWPGLMLWHCLSRDVNKNLNISNTHPETLYYLKADYIPFIFTDILFYFLFATFFM